MITATSEMAGVGMVMMTTAQETKGLCDHPDWKAGGARWNDAQGGIVYVRCRGCNEVVEVARRCAAINAKDGSRCRTVLRGEYETCWSHSRSKQSVERPRKSRRKRTKETSHIGQTPGALLRTLSQFQNRSACTAEWLRASGLPDRTFYHARLTLVRLGLVVHGEPALRHSGGRTAWRRPNIMTDAGQQVIGQ